MAGVSFASTPSLPLAYDPLFCRSPVEQPIAITPLLSSSHNHQVSNRIPCLEAFLVQNSVSQHFVKRRTLPRCQNTQSPQDRPGDSSHKTSVRTPQTHRKSLSPVRQKCHQLMRFMQGTTQPLRKWFQSSSPTLYGHQILGKKTKFASIILQKF